MRHKDVYQFTPGVKSACAIFAVLLTIIIFTIPVAVYFMIKRRTARLSLDARGFDVSAFGLTSTRWEYSELARIGILPIEIIGGGLGGMLARKMNGGSTAVNLCAITRSGKKPRFMISRFEDYQEILSRIQKESNLELENVKQGLLGPKWPDKN